MRGGDSEIFAASSSGRAGVRGCGAWPEAAMLSGVALRGKLTAWAAAARQH